MSRAKNIKNIMFQGLDKIKEVFRDYFIADGTNNEDTRKKHVRVGVGLLFGIVGIIIIFGVASEYIDSGKLKRSSKKVSNISKGNQAVEVVNLKNGVSHEQTWMEGAEQQILDLKVQQQLNSDKQSKIEEILEKDTISKKDLLVLLEQYKRENEEKLASIANNHLSPSNSMNQQLPGSSIEVIENKTRIKRKKIGSYIPAGSYVEAKMISGVDAGIGMMAEADPRQVLLRVTGKLISAGFKKDYLTTDKLMGCVVQCQAVGDLSSEKAYLKPVVMTCAKDRESIIEIPVKGYVSANGKVGIRGEIVSREGDLVAKSFLSGLIGGIGSGASQSFEPSSAISGGFAVKTSNESVRNVLGSGLGKGINDSSSRLSDYLIKRAEQYQPVISINEGVAVDLVFQEGFSMNEEDDHHGKN
jgi:conjugal transfer pilus assembly protein TraB